jgi:serine/threonine protein kinase
VDKVKALQLEGTLRGREVGGWTVERFVDHGKSAAVFRASRPSELAAVKVFDDELIERYGDKAQLTRIERELSLVGHDHPNLVRIFGGGIDPISGNHYLTMEFLDGPNLKTCLREVPTEVVPSLVQQLASAARYLECRNLVHRDIKPENIVLLDNYRRLVLLDLGVLRPVGEPGLTDPAGIPAFVGTLQYSSPEFLLRKEEDTIDGWRALSFYQIGGVIHDLIMRRPLFEEFANPYARLVLAVQNEVPIVISDTAPAYLIDLAKRCLLKDPKLRTRFVVWNDFDGPIVGPAIRSAKDLVAERISFARATQETAPEVATSGVPGKEEYQRTIIDDLKVAARSIRASEQILPPLTTTVHPGDGSGLCFAFDVSNALQLPKGLRIYVTVDVLDPTAQVVVIRGCACIGTTKPSREKIRHVILEGIYEVVSMYERLETFIYEATLWAQMKADAGAENEMWPDEATGAVDGSNMVDSSEPT